MSWKGGVVGAIAGSAGGALLQSAMSPPVPVGSLNLIQTTMDAEAAERRQLSDEAMARGDTKAAGDMIQGGWILHPTPETDAALQEIADYNKARGTAVTASGGVFIAGVIIGWTQW